ncbi:hypothetical protein CBM2634_B140063 [Cupriavidus taiwanensis]|uniref:Uncharacterized protein n=1 Tax=Cupriavidus taiwanensis TaxID=164546 RepID=A0A375J654_9BURK|nr:hypothetical protein CBM2634_B140063 [Cupriavidus taiwanensis]
MGRHIGVSKSRFPLINKVGARALMALIRVKAERRSMVRSALVSGLCMAFCHTAARLMQRNPHPGATSRLTHTGAKAVDHLVAHDTAAHRYGIPTTEPTLEGAAT